jgi:aminocarboxymuconate-semialdehyde decarboxylase
VIIDAHAHLLPRDYPAGSPTCFPRMEPIDGDSARMLLFGGTRLRARDVFFDAERRIEEQDVSGVDVEVLSPMPFLLRYDIPDGLSLARYVNEFTATLCSADPTRLLGFGLVPMQDPAAATAELAAIRDQGLRGVEIASNVLGTQIGHPRLLPFFAEAERLDLAVFVHAVPTGSDDLPASYVVGVEGARAAASMIAGGTAAACPDLRISFSHAAGGFPLMLPGAQYFWGGSWNEDQPVSPGEWPSPLVAARRFYYDSLIFDRRALRYLIELLGQDRLLVGSDFPAMPRERPIARTLRSMDLPGDVFEDIAWRNAFRWLGTDPQSTAGIARSTETVHS